MTKDPIEEAFSTERALKLALEALEDIASGRTYDPWTNGAIAQHIAEDAITAIKQTLLTATPLAAPYVATQLVQEPVAWMWTHKTAGKVGVYFEHPSKFFDLTKPSDYEWTPLYTAPPNVATPLAAITQEELQDLKRSEHEGWRYADELEQERKRLTAQRKPLKDEQFLELILRNGTVELVDACTFVGGSIQMQGKIGLLRSAKVIKEFVEAAHGIKENT